MGCPGPVTGACRQNTVGDQPIRAFVAAFEYLGPAKNLVFALKNRGSYRAALLASRAIVGALQYCEVPVELITWAPASSATTKGFDQGELLARTVSAISAIKAVRLLRAPSAVERKALGRSERVATAGPTLLDRDADLATGRRILLVDDVATTGSTLRSAAHVLAANGAMEVYAAAAAYTPVWATRFR